MPACVNLPFTGRDVRLDLFPGLANWAIFLDHIPHEALSWLTIKHYGFSDAADLFVFISGYTAALVFGRLMIERGYVAAAAKLAKRALQLYVAHIAVIDPQREAEARKVNMYVDQLRGVPRPLRRELHRSVGPARTADALSLHRPEALSAPER